MPARPLVSVLVPTYNRATMVEEAVRSAQRQTYAELEIVVADNASTDSTPRVLERLTASDDRVRVIRQSENRGWWSSELPGPRRVS